MNTKLFVFFGLAILCQLSCSFKLKNYPNWKYISNTLVAYEPPKGARTTTTLKLFIAYIAAKDVDLQLTGYKQVIYTRALKFLIVLLQLSVTALQENRDPVAVFSHIRSALNKIVDFMNNLNSLIKKLYQKESDLCIKKEDEIRKLSYPQENNIDAVNKIYNICKEQLQEPNNDAQDADNKYDDVLHEEKHHAGKTVHPPTDRLSPIVEMIKIEFKLLSN